MGTWMCRADRHLMSPEPSLWGKRWCWEGPASAGWLLIHQLSLATPQGPTSPHQVHRTSLWCM